MTYNTAGILLGEDGEKVEAINSGFSKLDTSMGGFRCGNTYLLSGLEKSGKTSLLLNWVSNFIKQGKHVTFVSTEMSYKELVLRTASIRGIKPGWDKSHEKSELNEQLKNNFSFVGVEDLVVDGGLSVKQMEAVIGQRVVNGSDIVIVDNLTTFGSQQSSSEPSWQKVAVAITKIVNMAKVSNLPFLIVLHIKPSTTFKETPSGIKSLIENDQPLKIFDESVTIINKPSLVDVYGGGGVLSQLSGAILLWRPYQKFDKSSVKGASAIILESMRHSESGVMIRAEYDGASGRFTEEVTLEEARKLFN